MYVTTLIACHAETLHFDNAHITPSNHIKNFGIYIDCHMTFDVYIQEMHKKVMGMLFFLKGIKDKFEINTRKIVVQSLALSIINCCLPVYGATNSTLLWRVQKLQNFAAKVCAGGARSDHATPFITQLEWFKIEKKVIFEVAVNVFKIKSKPFPDWFMQFSTNNEILQNSYSTPPMFDSKFLHLPKRIAFKCSSMDFVRCADLIFFTV